MGVKYIPKYSEQHCVGRERGGCGFPSEEELEDEQGQAGTEEGRGAGVGGRGKKKVRK